MSDPAGDSHNIALTGTVAELFERGGERRARVMLHAPQVIEVVIVDPTDIHLGDAIAVEACVYRHHNPPRHKDKRP